MIQPESLDQKKVKIVMPLLQAEYEAFYYYRALSNYCQGVGFEKAAAFFAKESEDELGHAKKIENMLVDWNVTVALPEILSPKTEFDSLVDGIDGAYSMELALYNLYNEKMAEIMAVDQGLYINMYELVKGQYQAVVEYSDKLNMLEGVEPTKTNLLLLEEKLF